jgi:hypothetical protein
MSDWITQQTRKAQALASARESMRGAGMPTPRTDEAEMEPMLPDEHKLAAIIADLSEGLRQQATATNHVATHIGADLSKRVEQLESAPKAKPGEKSQPKAKPRKK